MVTRRPLVSISGLRTELPPGDAVVGASVGTLVAGSGLDDGGDLSETTSINVSLAPNPSGLIFVGDKYLGVDGVAQRTGETALSSGNFSLSTGADALASGIAGSSLAATALASGNAALTDITAIPGGTIETYTAASAVVSGYAVGLDDTGSVQSINKVETDNSNPPTFGSTFDISTDAVNMFVQIYDSVNQQIIYVDSSDASSGYLVVKLGTLSGTTVTYGTPSVIYSTTGANPVKIIYDELEGVYVVVVRRTTGAYVVTFTVSGSTVSAGTVNQASSGSTHEEPTIEGDSNGKFVVFYANALSSNYGTYRVGTLTGTSVSFGSNTTFNSAECEHWGSAFDSTNEKIVVFYLDKGSSPSATVAQVATISGSSISFGSKTSAPNNETFYNPRFGFAFHESAGKIICAVRADASSYGVYVATVSGTSVSFGTRTSIDSTLNAVSVAYDSVGGKLLIAYGRGGSEARVKIGTLSGTTVSLGSSVQILSSRVNTDQVQVIYDSGSNKLVTAMSNYTNGQIAGIVANPLVDISYTPTISSKNNFIGIAQTSAASGSAVQVRLPGSYDQNNTGLTTGAVYYVDPTTSGISTTATEPTSWNGAVSWGSIGRAVNSTTLLLTDMI